MCTIHLHYNQDRTSITVVVIDYLFLATKKERTHTSTSIHNTQAGEMADSRASPFFDPDNHPDDTLKSFAEFAEDFELRYAASYPGPPKVSLDSAIQRWKLINDKKSYL